MSWDLSKARIEDKGRIEDCSSGAQPAESSPGAPDQSHADGTDPPDASERRSAAGMVRHQAGADAVDGAGNFSPELVYGTEHECTFCRGKGERARGGQCPVCHGDGKVSVGPAAVRCAFCRGRGELPPLSGLTCTACRGKGLVAVDPPVLVCPECKGRGRRRAESLYCGRCRGAGVIQRMSA